MLNNRQIKYVYSLAAQGRAVDAANYVLQTSGEADRVNTVEQANEALHALYYSYLSNGNLDAAALLAWGEVMFTVRPRAVRKVWDALNDPKES